ncbi:S-adenosyl-L-methionine-dependent methyltransferase [Xylaria sp. FL1777]|nr:S-adenosyl-L-methionine-dependent methyltransferase [Xylaria sp. FL1777]
MAADFEKQSYWHDRFASEAPFEWLTPSTTFISLMEPYLSPSGSQRILHLGSGTSDLHIRLREKGHHDVTNVDYEPLALDRGRQMEERFFGDVVMKYAVADVTRLLADLPRPRAFDLVVDKSTVDAVSCGGDEPCLAMAQCVRECLAAGGLWISLSYSAARFQLDGLPFDVCVIGKIPTPKAKVTDPDVYYWCYLLRPL